MDEKHFEFGDNWANYSSNIGQEEIDNAAVQLKKLTGDLHGKTFLDIGSGSGLHSLAAFALGAEEVVAIDYDPMSVQTTQAMLQKFAPEKKWQAFQDDILNPTLEGKYDVVYSWGVLHHTGDMYTAIQNASKYCEKNSIFAIALYVKTPLCNLWTKEKALYTYHPVVRPFIRIPYTALLMLRQAIATRAPIQFIKEYKKARGMNFFTDIEDWLGGYPYESITDDEIKDFMASMQFGLLRSFNTSSGIGVFGTGCGEWVFHKR